MHPPAVPNIVDFAADLLPTMAPFAQTVADICLQLQTQFGFQVASMVCHMPVRGRVIVVTTCLANFLIASLQTL
jgi:hypothetical protein